MKTMTKKMGNEYYFVMDVQIYRDTAIVTSVNLRDIQNGQNYTNHKKLKYDI